LSASAEEPGDATAWHYRGSTLGGDAGRLCGLIVHGFEVELGDRRISPDSPLGRAVLGRRVGDVVEVPAPSGTYRCTVTAASRTA